MLETIRQFSEEQLGGAGDADEARDAHAGYFAGREADVLALWDSPQQREAYEWFTIELPNLRTAFRWAADHDDLDTAAAIATFAAFLGFWVETVRARRVDRGAYRAGTFGRPPSAGAALRDGDAVLRGRAGSTTPSVMQRPAGSPSTAGVSTRFRMTSKAGWVALTSGLVRPSSGFSCAAT